MPAENTQQPILTQQLLYRLLAEIVRAVSLWIFFKVPVYCLLIVHWVSPHQVTENSIKGNFLLAIDLIDLVKLFETWGDATMHG